MKRLKVIAIAFFVAITLMLSASKAIASEGTAELRSASVQDSRCFVSSILMPSFDYHILVSCRSLVYPPAVDKFSYILWANPTSDKNPIKLGEISQGKAQLKTNKAFASLFVTMEKNDRIRTPSSDVVMQGNMQSIQFLEGAPQPQPTTAETPAETFGDIISKPTPSPTVMPQKPGGFLSGVSKLGVVIAVILFIFILIIAAITRARG